MKLEPKLPEQSRFASPLSASPSGGRLDDLPAPRASRGGRGLGCLALLALLVVAGAAVWLTRDDATREAWRKDAVTWLDARLEGTPLSPLMNLLRETPPPPPPSVASPATEPGTLAGPTIQGTVSALVRTDFVLPGGTLPATDGQEAPKRQYPSDSRVQPAFVDDLAGHVLDRFQGKGLDLGPASLNQRYGVKLTGLAGGSRSAVLRYAFHPDMLRSLYTIYADRFLDSLDRQSTERNWSELQKRQLHLALAGRLNAWAAALDGVAAVPDLAARLAESERLLQESLDIYSRMAGTVFELDEARQRNDAAAMATAQLRVDDITARYRQALDARNAAQHALVGDIRRQAGAALDEESLLYVAQWVGRRLQEDRNALGTVRAGTAVLRDMAGRCTRIGSGQSATPRQAEAPAAASETKDVPLRPGPKQALPRPATAPAPVTPDLPSAPSVPAVSPATPVTAPAAPAAAPSVTPGASAPVNGAAPAPAVPASSTGAAAPGKAPRTPAGSVPASPSAPSAGVPAAAVSAPAAPAQMSAPAMAAPKAPVAAPVARPVTDGASAGGPVLPAPSAPVQEPVRTAGQQR